MPTRVTSTLIRKLKKQAKQRAAESGMPHGQALEIEAKSAGFASWHALLQSRVEPATVAGELPVDPELPEDFDDTPNEQRTKAEIDTWWDRPFCCSLPDGKFEVRCLDGGAWDRSTWYGIADTLEQAAEIARKKLASWKAFRTAETVLLDVDGTWVVRMPQRPDENITYLRRLEPGETLSRRDGAAGG